MAEGHRMRITFWGVRGSTPTPGEDYLRYGGNTSCLEIRSSDGDLLIFDAGTGIRDLGNKLTGEFGSRPLSLNLFLTHYHWDHIQGIPFFQPLYTEDNEVTFFSGKLEHGISDLLQKQMMSPFFPLPFTRLPARRIYTEIVEHEYRLDSFVITPFRLNHPQGCMGYRIESGGAVLVYATDHEHGDPQADARLRAYSQDADVLVYDAMYEPDEYRKLRVGWGHSTWEEGAKLADECGVKRLILFHHNPDYDDDRLDEIERKVQSVFPDSQFARETSVVSI